MTIPKPYQTGFSDSPLNKSLRDNKGFFSLHRIYNRLKYYFVFVSITGAFILCFSKVFQRIETSYQGNLSALKIANNHTAQEKKEESSLFTSVGKIFPFKIGKEAKAATNPTTSNAPPLPTTANGGPASTTANGNVQQNAQQPASPEFDPLAVSSEEEVKILQTLAHRRQELDKREEALSKRELLLTTAQNQLKEQMASLQKLKADIDSTLKTADKAEKDKIMTLVKIYENMKPKDAARIFDQMETKLLTDVVKMMNQKKISVILGQMNVAKAKELTALIINLKSPYAKIN